MMTYTFHPTLRRRSFKRLADRLDHQSFYLLELLLMKKESAPFTYEQIEAISEKAHRFHTGLLLRKCLLELELAGCLIVQLDGKRSL